MLMIGKNIILNFLLEIKSCSSFINIILLELKNSSWYNRVRFQATWLPPIFRIRENGLLLFCSSWWVLLIVEIWLKLVETHGILTLLPVWYCILPVWYIVYSLSSILSCLWGCPNFNPDIQTGCLYVWTVGHFKWWRVWGLVVVC